jgi:glycosyltransferase involved in cell wall biosynthesis
MTLSVSIIVLNGEPLIRRCVESVAWADEIVVVDSGSTDNTRDLCRALGANVMQTADFPGYGKQKNRTLDQTTGDWILAPDHNEWVTPELRAEIGATLTNAGETVAYALPQLSKFCGREMQRSGSWPDPVIRLFYKGTGRFAEDHMHDGVIVNGAVGRLQHPLRHDPETHRIPLILQIAAGQRDAVQLFGDDYNTPDGTCVRGYVHVTDLCAAHLLALHRLWEGAPIHAYNLCSGSDLSVRQVIAAAEQAIKRRINVITRLRRTGDPARLVADATRAHNELSWRPAFCSLDNILAHAWRWTRKCHLQSGSAIPGY